MLAVQTANLVPAHSALALAVIAFDVIRAVAVHVRDLGWVELGPAGAFRLDSVALSEPLAVVVVAVVTRRRAAADLCGVSGLGVDRWRVASRWV